MAVSGPAKKTVFYTYEHMMVQESVLPPMTACIVNKSISIVDEMICENTDFFAPFKKYPHDQLSRRM